MLISQDANFTPSIVRDFQTVIEMTVIVSDGIFKCLLEDFVCKGVHHTSKE